MGNLPGKAAAGAASHTRNNPPGGAGLHVPPAKRPAVGVSPIPTARAT